MRALLDSSGFLLVLAWMYHPGRARL